MKRDYFKKKGTGVWARPCFFVRRNGINRRIQKVDRLQGIKSYYQIQDVGQPGVLLVRRMSCHQCEGCLSVPKTEEEVHAL